jgi:CubicO group peptidase (beta-lactamase class C family)
MRNSKYRSISSVLILCLLTLPLAAEKLPRVDPDKAGMSAERLERITTAMQQYIDQGKLPGLVTLVTRDGKIVYFKALGKLDVGRGVPMSTDAIFRIASQSKALTSVAIMILLEDGRLLLNDPVSKFIPEFKNSRVAVKGSDKDSQGYSTAPARREITIRDLLTHTSGISYGSGPAEELYKASGVHGWYFADQSIPIGDAIRKLAALPFDAHPGEKYIYGFSTDILGHVVEVISGKSLAEFTKERITDPLKMNDTHFYLPPEKLNRFTPVYGAKDGKLQLIDEAGKNDYVNGPRVSFSGGAGLLSTAEDYARFLQMLCNGGELEGIRLLSPKTVQLMTVNHVGNLFSENQGFGLGFWITEHLGRAGEPGSVGAFGWGGAYHTSYWVDPAERLVAVLMTQMLPAGNLDDHGKFRALVYQAITTSYQTQRVPGS